MHTDFFHPQILTVSLFLNGAAAKFDKNKTDDMTTKEIRKRHELFTRGSQVKYIVLTALTAAVIIALIIVVFFLFNKITT